MDSQFAPSSQSSAVPERYPDPKITPELQHNVELISNPVEYAIHWGAYTPESVVVTIRDLIEKLQKRIDHCKTLSQEEQSFRSVFLELEYIGAELSNVWGPMSHLSGLKQHDTEFRNAYDAMLAEISAFSSSIPLDHELWTVVKNCAEKIKKDDSLTEEDKRLVWTTIQDFELAGADLPEDKREALKIATQELSVTTSKYSKNANRSSKAWELYIDNPKELDGVPERVMEQMKEEALKKGHGTEDKPCWRLSLDYPVYGPVISRCTNRDLRKKLWEARSSVATEGEYDNKDIIKHILKLRFQIAQLLGYKTYADMTTHLRMIKRGSNIVNFISKLHDDIYPQFMKDWEEVNKFADEKREPKDRVPLEPWDLSFWGETMRREIVGWDPEVVRPYLPVSHVLNKLFEIAQTLFGISLKEVPGYVVGQDHPEEAIEVWESSVRVFQFYREDKLINTLFMDLYPREGKNSGAWADGFRRPHPDCGCAWPRMGTICANLSPPVGGAKEALLSHSEVSTIFHEFGHMLNFTFTRSIYHSLGWDGIPWDFIEVPSQLMENWVWDEKCLKQITCHYETGKPLPDDLIAKLHTVRCFRAATGIMAQLSYSRVDLSLHQESGFEVPEDPVAVARDACKGYISPTPTPPVINPCDFGHLFSSSTGYSAGYYSYMWSEMIEADFFERFKKCGIMNPKIGAEYRDNVLAVGYLRDYDEVFRDFMGRDPSTEALLARYDIVAGELSPSLIK